MWASHGLAAEGLPCAIGPASRGNRVDGLGVDVGTWSGRYKSGTPPLNAFSKKEGLSSRLVLVITRRRNLLFGSERRGLCGTERKTRFRQHNIIYKHPISKSPPRKKTHTHSHQQPISRADACSDLGCCSHPQFKQKKTPHRNPIPRDRARCGKVQEHHSSAEHCGHTGGGPCWCGIDGEEGQPHDPLPCGGDHRPFLPPCGVRQPGGL